MDIIMFKEKITIENKRVFEKWEGPVDFIGNKELREKIVEIVTNRENFIDKGGAGQVFDLGTYCIKLMKNRHNSDLKYNIVNPPQKEYEIQGLLGNVTIDGVFAPRVYGMGEGKEDSAIVMGRLDAVNMQKVLNGEEGLPENFSLDGFFADLESYIANGVHELGIIHNDLEPRNIMIDKKTGKPRLIDFGRSLYFERKPDNFEVLANNELKKVEICNEKMEKFINRSNKKQYV